MSRPIRVLIKRTGGAADVALPTKMTEHAAGFDLAAAVAKPVTLKPGDIHLVPCGFSMAVPHGYEAQVRPRVTILIVTHNMQQASRVSDYTAFMYLGQLVEFDETKTVFTNPSQRLTEEYITGRFG